ncbi:hypothetical protein ACKVWC_005118 [Pyricularia oryzae]
MRHRFSLTWPVPAALASLLPFSLFLLLQFITLATAQTNPQAPPPHLPERTYLDTVCRPPILHMGDAVAPCISIETTEALCYPNGTTALHLDAHAQCLCRGSFFAEWTACRACLSLHGLLDDADRSFYQAVAMSASSVLCGFLTEPAAAPAPTTIFKAIFSSIAATLPGRSASGQGGSLAATAAGAASPGPDDKAPYQTEYVCIIRRAGRKDRVLSRGPLQLPLRLACSWIPARRLFPALLVRRLCHNLVQWVPLARMARKQWPARHRHRLLLPLLQIPGGGFVGCLLSFW